jgi:putative transposase
MPKLPLGAFKIANRIITEVTVGRAWPLSAFFGFAPSIRKMIYTTNCVEALNRSLRKIIKTCGSFPNDEAALKLLYLAIKNAGLRWRRGIEWTAAMGNLLSCSAIAFPGRHDDR